MTVDGRQTSGRLPAVAGGSYGRLPCRIPFTRDSERFTSVRVMLAPTLHKSFQPSAMRCKHYFGEGDAESNNLDGEGSSAGLFLDVFRAEPAH